MNSERKKFLLQQVEDYVVTCVEEDIYDGCITPEEGEWVYNTVGHRGLRGLFPRYIGEPKRRPRMSLYKQLVLYKDVGQVIPEEVLSAGAEQHDQMVALAAASDNAIQVVRSIGKADVKLLAGIEESYKDFPILFVMGQAKDNAQPFVILGSENNPELAMFIQGDDSILEKLKKKLLKEFKATGSMEEFFNSFTDQDDDTAYNEVCALMGTDSTVLVLGQNGQIAQFDTGTLEQKFDWGSAYADPQPADGGTKNTEVEEPVAAKPSLAGLSLAKSTDQPEQVAASAKRRPDGWVAARITNPKTRKVESVVFNHSAEPWMQCPVNGASGGHITKPENHAWHLENFGVIPENWKERPLFPFHMKIAKTNVDLKDIKDPSTANPDTPKDTGTRHSRGPNMTKADIDSFKRDHSAKIFGSNTETIVNPANLLVTEGNIKPIYELLERESINDVFLPYLPRLYVAQNEPEFAARMWGDVQNAATNRATRIKELEDACLKEQEENENLRKENAALKKGAPATEVVAPKRAAIKL